MAQIYQKTVSDKTCILAPREFILRPFNFGTDWTEVRVGAYFGGVASSGDNTDSAIESVTIATAADLITFGIKDSVTNDLPGFGDALFLGGITDTGQASYCSGSGFGDTTANKLCAAGAHETTIVGGSVVNTLGSISAFPASASGATGYNAFMVLKFVISNRGLSSQTVTISGSGTSPIAGTDYSAAALRLLMNNATFGTGRVIAWNDGAVARDIPDAFFCRVPFYNNRIRLSAIRCIRYAP